MKNDGENTLIDYPGQLFFTKMTSKDDLQDNLQD